MRKIEKQALVVYSPGQMFELVDDIDAYASFLPWCSHSQVLSRENNMVQGELAISYGQLNKTFVTRNVNTPQTQIEMQLIDGPFKELNGQWTFHELGNDGCKICLNMMFEFESKLLDLTVGSVFSQIANSLVDAFVERAKQVYG